MKNKNGSSKILGQTMENQGFIDGLKSGRI